MVIASAGRRIDAVGAQQARFPSSAEARVSSEILSVLQHLDPTALVCSAACGADILALEAAGSLGIRRRVVLPCSGEEFRRASVEDRLDNWGQRYDVILADIEAHNDLMILGVRDYRVANERILDEAQQLGPDVRALVIWDGSPRDASDLTEHFRQAAIRRGIAVTELLTL